MEKINIVWLKRDLRINDHLPIYNAINQNERFLLLYVFEEIFQKDPHYSERHLDFIKQSLFDMNDRLRSYNTSVLISKGNIIDVFDKITKKFMKKKYFVIRKQLYIVPIIEIK